MLLNDGIIHDVMIGLLYASYARYSPYIDEMIKNEMFESHVFN
jgi:hypothetical protein